MTLHMAGASISDEDRKFMKLAIDKSREGVEHGQTPFGACIVRDGEVIACACNRVWDATDITAHAEVVAIREACAKLGTISLRGCAIYSSTEPCPMCFSAIHWAGMDRIFFGASIADAERFGFRELAISNEKMRELGGAEVRVTGGVMAAEAITVFKVWARRGDRRPY
jgi:tRNA(Arg) A34 adenosine deaminase TadA